MKEDFRFPSNDGLTQIHAIRVAPEGEPRAILQLVHGMTEYIDRYVDFAEFMAGNGYLVVGSDHLGHGQSIRTEEDLGYFADAPVPSDVVVDDMHRLRGLTQEQYPGLPYTMLGHSMGSFMVRKYITRYADGLSAVILSGTGDQDLKTAKAGLALVKTMTKLHGGRYRSDFVTKQVFGSSYSRFDLTGEDPANSWLTKDVGIVKKYYSDPLCTFQFRLNGYQGLMETAVYIGEPKHIAETPKDLPILIASGADDPVGECSVGIRRLEKKFQDAGLNVRVVLYENDRHEILNETDRDVVYSDMLRFLDQYVK